MSQPQKTCFILWLKFKPEFAQNPTKGTVNLRNNFRADSERDRNYAMKRLINQIIKHKMASRIWKARIYEHPGNHIRYDWSEEQDD